MQILLRCIGIQFTDLIGLYDVYPIKYRLNNIKNLIIRGLSKCIIKIFDRIFMFVEL
jgi:hypothetical protein